MSKYIRRKKRHLKLMPIVLIILSGVLIFLFNYLPNRPLVYKLYIDENNDLVAKFNVLVGNTTGKISCYLSNSEEKPSIDSELWISSEKNSSCTFKLDNNSKHYMFLKNDKEIFSVLGINSLYRINTLEFDKDSTIISLNSTVKLNIKYEYTGYLDKEIKYKSSNKDILTVNNSGEVTSVSIGKATITASIKDKEDKINIEVTDLIVNRPNSFDFDKDYLPCNKYSEEENNKLDTLLKEKIESVGYKTRAGAVEAARFLTLDFPYRVNYFYENGRVAQGAKIDGEGRYYHIGLYLNDKKYSEIGNHSTGPKIWGCSLYDNPAHRNIDNGLDCSGFVSWAMLNGGFDPGDIGAGITNVYDLTDTGKRTTLTSSLAKGNTIKAGDLLWRSAGGGHIGMIIGIDDDTYYVAEALWYDEIGVIISTYSKNSIANKFPYVILMDSYYEKDGSYTKMWY